MVGPMPPNAVTLTVLDYPALFGKLPGHGDFVSRGVQAGARAGIDQWLSDWIAATRTSAGADFVELFEAAAPWLLESPHCTAVLLPSRDAVGRHFPLLAVCQADRETQRIYDAMIDALINGADCDQLRAALAGLPAGDPGAVRLPDWFLPDGAGPTLPSPGSLPSWRSVEGYFV